MNLISKHPLQRCWALLIIFCLLLFSGCNLKSSPNSANAPQKDKKTIVTSFYPMYIMALNITAGIPEIELVNLTGPQTGCLHDYQLTPNNVKTLQKADFFIVNGAGAESFLDKTIQQQPQLKIITASQGIQLMESHEHEHEHGHGHGEEMGNPHVWVSIDGAIKEVNNIATQLADLDPDRAAQYRKNAAVYTAKLENLQQDMHRELDGIDNRNIVTFHEAFPYFAKEFNLNVVAVVQREPGSDPSPAELAETIQLVRKSQAKALFTEPQYPTGAAQAIARDTGAKIYILDPAVNGPDDPDAYLQIMRKNLKTLTEALR